MPCPRLKNTKVGKIMKSCGNLDVKITRPWNNHSFFAAFLKEPPGPPWPFAMSRVNLFFSWSCAIWMTMMKIILLISPHVTLREWQGSTEGLEHEIDKMRFWDLLYTNYEITKYLSPKSENKEKWSNFFYLGMHFLKRIKHGAKMFLWGILLERLPNSNAFPKFAPVSHKI